MYVPLILVGLDWVSVLLCGSVGRLVHWERVNEIPIDDLNLEGMGIKLLD